MKPIDGSDRKSGDDMSVIGPRRRRVGQRPQWRGLLAQGASVLTGRTWGRIAVLGVLGLVVGYAFATRVVFPAPVAPTDLVQVPDLAGSTVAESNGTLTELGLVVGDVDSVRHPSVPEGTVFGQSPLPGQWAQAGAAVRISLSSGRQEVRIPELEGAPLSQVAALLEASGFTVEVDSVESSAPRGDVVSMDPAAGEAVQLPTTVRLSVSLGPPMVAVPRLIGLSEEEATAELEALGLIVEEVEVRFRFGLDQGRVIEQEPAPGREIEEGSGVRLVVGRRARDGGS